MKTETKLTLHALMLWVVAIGAALAIVILSKAYADDYITGYGTILEFDNGDEYNPQTGQWKLNLDTRSTGDADYRSYQYPYTQIYQSNEETQKTIKRSYEAW